MANKDEMLQIDLCNGQVRVMLCETTETVQRCADIHSSTPVCTAALGRLMTGTLMLGVMLKGEGESVSVTVKGGGPMGALVAVGARADLLIILTDTDGLYTADPRTDPDARLIPEVWEITPAMRESAGGNGTKLSTGGMVTKLAAAQLCMEAGADMIICNSADPAVLYDILDGKAVGTRFIGRKQA